MKMPRIDKGPELKLPKLSKPKLRRSSGRNGASDAATGSAAPKPPKRGGPPISERVPAPVADLVRDLRDRRLLIPAIALIVALAAVPLLLTRSDDPPVLPVAEPLAGEADAVAPAVLVDSTGVRDYEKRLASLKSKNPFSAPATVNLDPPTQETVSEDVSVTDDGSTDLGTDVLPGDPIPADPGITPPGAPVDPGAPAEPPDTDTDTGGGNGGNGNSNGGNGGNGNDKPEIRYITERISYRVDASVGEQGQSLTPLKDLGFFQALPSENSAAAWFVGTEDGRNRAAFVISKDVTRVSGEQSCFPSPDNCQWAFLDPQSTMNLTYQPEGEPVERVYELRVDQIKRVKERVKD